MGEFNVNDYLIITDVTKVNGLEDMLFVSWFPYKVESITKDNTAVIKNGKHTFIFTPLEMQHVIKANETQIEKAFTKFKKGDKVVVPDVSRLLYGDTLDITAGVEYEVFEIDKYGLPIIKDNYNGRFGFLKGDLLFINKIETFKVEEVECNTYQSIEQYDISDRVLLTNLDKIKGARGRSFFYNKPYDIVDVSINDKALTIKNGFSNQLIISGEELKYIKPYIDIVQQKEIHNFIDELEKKHIKHNVSIMIDEALKEGRFDRAKEIVDMGLQFE
ncbi:hypothetical protein M3649_03625 [Ureibacillus chungkukjangi]|uniref:hypothetical protein n=1 Tax=Ureibacillus chungkukjangi TaxID=1202712 RepID=UPI002040B1AD|nr:hypothetical protein [Ureibacillus chungkukjangi]MCM3387220.1 hypothetical protein [Ureibacillus chungkukjangi]